MCYLCAAVALAVDGAGVVELELTLAGDAAHSPHGREHELDA